MLLHRLVWLLPGNQVSKEHGLLLFQIVPGRIGPNLPHPGRKLAVALEAVQVGKGLNVGILKNVQDRILVLDHGLDGVEHLVVGLLVQGSQGILVPFPGQSHQTGQPVSRLLPSRRAERTGFISLWNGSSAPITVHGVRLHVSFLW